ncbi:hypothetical protein FJ692_14760 [Pseudomonas fluorescens]|uniref:Uncharacterized protein n=1 Tax=Pseudomonas azotoformans TaxID=47878 RepID=A0A4V1K0H3_PSEAZ|nr:hypothetical protein C1751_00575 [Pseudomonas fluorescens]RXE50856.1 hypothetical protein B4O85_21325 [Pseudomonas azotoformans]TPV56757.1 hypothetical protein FJ692_14760 [Pseudomonas fluorescens]
MRRPECGSWLACDADTSVHPSSEVDTIAGKPAPTFVLCASNKKRPLMRPFCYFQSHIMYASHAHSPATAHNRYTAPRSQRS